VTKISIERLWRTIEYEEVCLYAYASTLQERALIDRYLGFYDSWHPHSSLDGKTPDQACFNLPMPKAVAAQPRRKTTYETHGTCSVQPNHL
jgi:putative transposase